MIHFDTTSAQARDPSRAASEFFEPRPLNSFGFVVVAGMALLVALGIFVAMINLPVITGCAFYGKCDSDLQEKAPDDLGVSPVE